MDQIINFIFKVIGNIVYYVITIIFPFLTLGSVMNINKGEISKGKGVLLFIIIMALIMWASFSNKLISEEDRPYFGLSVLFIVPILMILYFLVPLIYTNW
jgi:hypothetical protein